MNKSACGIYLAIAVRILDGYQLNKAIYEGVKKSLDSYTSHSHFTDIVSYWDSIADIGPFQQKRESDIKSDAFVVEALAGRDIIDSRIFSLEKYR